jgi:hypothetical protein
MGSRVNPFFVTALETKTKCCAKTKGDGTIKLQELETISLYQNLTVYNGIQKYLCHYFDTSENWFMPWYIECWVDKCVCYL